jgi:clan AA aspartic protease
MNTFTYEIAISSLRRRVFHKIEALIDTGATYTWIPFHILKKLGVRGTTIRKLQLANGKVVSRNAAEILVKINGETLSTLCIFGDDTSLSLLGAVTLEQFSLGVDPINKRLIPIVSLAI